MKNFIIYALLLVLANTVTLLGQTDLKKLSLEELDQNTNSLLKAGLFKDALPSAQLAVDKSASLLGKQDSLLAERVNTLGKVYYFLGQYKDCEKEWLRSKEIRAKGFGVKHQEYGSSLNNLAILYKKLGEYEKAEALYIECKKIYSESVGKESSNYATALTNLGALYVKTGRLKEAEPVLLESLIVFAKTDGKDSNPYNSTLNSLALVYWNLGRYDEAEPLFLQCIDLGKKLGKAPQSYASSVNNLALLYEDMLRFEDAEKLYKEAIEIYKKTVGIEHPSYGESVNNLANLYLLLKRYEEAKKYYNESKEITGKSLGKDHPDYARSLCNLAILYSKTNRFKDAETYYKKALEIYVKSFGIEHQEHLNALNLLAELYLNFNELDKVWEITQKAISYNCSNCPIEAEISAAWSKQILAAQFSSSSDLATTLQSIYYLLEKTPNPSNLEKQHIVSEVAMKVLEKSRNEFANEGDKLRILSKANNWTDMAIISIERQRDNPNWKKYKEDAFQYAETSKAALLLGAIQTEYAYSFGDLPDSLVRKEQNLLKDLAEIKALLLQPIDAQEKESLLAELSAVNLEFNDFQKNIEKKYPNYYKLKYAQQNPKVEEIQKMLSPKMALLEYFVGLESVSLFYIDQKEYQFYSIPVSQDSLNKRVEKLRLALSDYSLIDQLPAESYKLYHENASWFYEQLLKQALQGKDLNKLVIVPDGSLGHIPFEAFLCSPAPANPDKIDYSKLDYLIHHYSIQYNYSASLWKENLQSIEKHKNNKQLFAAAAHYGEAAPQTVSNNTSSVRGNLRSLRNTLVDLPEARKEVEELSKLFAGKFLYNEQASEAVFKNEAADYAIIHLAMHGLLDKKRPILSSLAFTDIIDSLEDNFLQAYEITHLKLQADLVVLSACETGFGKFQKGEGVMSLARSFMYAGVPSLVVSLWQVNDMSTSYIMQDFYKNLSKGMDKAEALREAKLKYIGRAIGIGSHPAYWSPFIQLGDSRPIVLKTKTNNYAWWGLGGGGTLLIVFMAFRRIRRKES